MVLTKKEKDFIVEILKVHYEELKEDKNKEELFKIVEEGKYHSLSIKGKKQLVKLLREHLKEVKENERLPDQNLVDLIEEKKYEEFLKDLIKKLES